MFYLAMLYLAMLYLAMLYLAMLLKATPAMHPSVRSEQAWDSNPSGWLSRSWSLQAPNSRGSISQMES